MADEWEKNRENGVNNLTPMNDCDSMIQIYIVTEFKGEKND